MNEDSSGYEENESDVENRYLTATSANGFHQGELKKGDILNFKQRPQTAREHMTVLEFPHEVTETL